MRRPTEKIMKPDCARFALPIAVDHPAFAGHFPGMPIVPGVVLLDLLLQGLERELKTDPAHWRCSSAKFFSTVAPGESLLAGYTLRDAGRVDFMITCGERKIAAGNFVLHPLAGGSC
jgi:3-hydroxyacyl-[acyl-carrier-protein] dehydratase